MAVGEKFLTTREVAEVFGVTPRAVRFWVKAGQLVAHQTPGGGKGPGHHRFGQDEVERFRTCRQDVPGIEFTPSRG